MSTPEMYTPRPGDLVHDRRTNRIGFVMDVVGRRLYLRPPGGGIEWTVDPRHVVPAESAESE
ncbi:hypothetical protein [Kitasatospora sp. NPDC056531]|uniref:hypothetical protein n=1 Tax=Kitasatospora sp. NPDC056531 TaxID=3345856 RepID=UPI00368DB04D